MSAQIQKRTETAVIPKTVKGWLSSDYFKTQVALCLPKHLTADRFVRVALTALTRIPKLGECTPESVIKCMMACSELGIEPDGRRAHLIPFKTECTLIIDYKGLVELAKRSGDVSNIAANVVCENDQFEYNTGEVVHKINFRHDRGGMYAAYAIITFKDGSKHCEVMTKGEIDAIRKRSRAGGNGPWVTDYNEMAKKTVFRRASKWVTLSPEISDALDRDGDAIPSAALVSETALTFPESAPEQPAIDVAPAPAAEEQAESDAGLAPEKAAKSPRAKSMTLVEVTPQQELAKLLTDAGFSFSDMQVFGRESGNLPDADSLPDFDSIDTKTAVRLLRSRSGLLDGIRRQKDGVAA